MRAPDFGAREEVLYQAAIDMTEWAEGLGFTTVTLNEHHNSVDGYLPAPMVMAAAIAARTSRIHIEIAALVITLHHPLRVAEDLAVLDLISGGRLSVVLGLGYRRPEFEMFGVDWRQRPSIVEEAIDALRRSWTGEPFEFRGHTVQVRPCPCQPGRPDALARRGFRSVGPALPPGWACPTSRSASTSSTSTSPSWSAWGSRSRRGSGVDPFVDRVSTHRRARPGVPAHIQGPGRGMGVDRAARPPPHQHLRQLGPAQGPDAVPSRDGR